VDDDEQSRGFASRDVGAIALRESEQRAKSI
jgi:hypothetical protein